MFNKKPKRTVGNSFPFISGENNEMKIKYDNMTVQQDGDYCIITFFQGDLPIYASTHLVDRQDYTISFPDLTGEVKIRIL